MPMNLLPLLLVGGAAAAYVVTADKKKKDEAKACPGTNKLSVGQLAPIGLAAFAKHGKKPNPTPEINHYIREILPKGCTRNSDGSLISITIPGIEESFDIPIPDFYAFMYMGASGRRVEEGVITKEQHDKNVIEIMKWYKETTGDNLDLIKMSAFGAFLMKMSDFVDDKKEGTDPGPDPGEDPAGPTCPANFDWLINEESVDEMKAAFDAGRAQNPSDPFKVADVMFQAFVPPGCTKSDYQSKVTMTLQIGSGSAEPMTVDIAAFYAMLVLDAASLMNLGPAKMAAVESKIQSNYTALTGNPLVL